MAGVPFRIPGKIKPDEEKVWVAPTFLICGHCRRTSPSHFDHCGACGERLIRPQEPPKKQKWQS